VTTSGFRRSAAIAIQALQGAWNSKRRRAGTGHRISEINIAKLEEIENKSSLTAR